jgi:serine phosphatase RsbU (regulator of sigma subunit)
MHKQFETIAEVFWPRLKEYTDQRHLIGIADVISVLWTLPFALIGMVWLVSITDLKVVQQHWQELLLLATLQFVFFRLSYFVIFEIRADRYASADGDLVSMVQWIAVFLLGPTALWISASWQIINFIRNAIRAQTTASRWVVYRTATHDMSTLTLASLVGVVVYQRLGGTFPLPSLTWNAIYPALAALIAHFLIFCIIWSVYTAFSIYIQQSLAGPENLMKLLRFLALALIPSNLAHPFAVQAAGIYHQNGPLAFLFFISGLFLVAFLGRQLSWAAESSRQRNRQLQQLENLGRAIINAEPDGSALPKILEEHVPAMFPSARIVIQVSPGKMLYKNPDHWSPDLDPVWDWGCKISAPQAFLNRDPLPWSKSNLNHDPLVLTPIRSVDDHNNIGCIYIELRSLSQPWDRHALNSLFPAAKTLADQIASALHQAKVYQETLALEATRQELKFAGRIQSSFLPTEIPTLDGWEIAIAMLPARETSGDFFDIIPLEDKKIGFLVADVADKGLGAALYMALCRTLIRTYALEYQEIHPDFVFASTNERLLKDSRVNLFISSFYGVINPKTNSLTYCNAGHNPPFLFSKSKGGKFISLPATGIPLGIEESSSWKRVTVKIEPGDVLVIYTDGIPDTLNENGESFREERLIKTIQGYLGLSAQDILASLIEEVQRFGGNTAQYDDITLIVISRNEQ